MPKTGILLTNTGTPDAPTPKALRRYLREFLSDKRVVRLPKLIWLPILYGLVLPVRPRQSAKLYQTIWMTEGAPMRVIMQSLRDKLTRQLPETVHRFEIEIGMHYGNPSIRDAINALRTKAVDQIIVLPLFPQYSTASTASTYDRIHKAIKKDEAWLPLIRKMDYADHPPYIDALAKSVHEHWQIHGRNQHLLISFHGVPKRYTETGDPYESQCVRTAHLLANALDLSQSEWTHCYQSRFGYNKWLEPSTQTLLRTLPKQGIKAIDIICPGFAIDCLETLEEIAITGKESFLAAGGETCHYIPALNDSDRHIDMLTSLIVSTLPSSR